MQRSYYTHALGTIERAQQQGFLKDQRDNYNLVTLHYQLHDYVKAAELLRNGLRSGAIEDKAGNWTTLGYFDEQVGAKTKSVDDLKEAIQHFPGDSDLYFQIGQDYSNDRNAPEAYHWFRQAVDHHQFHQQMEGIALYHLGYAAYEMQRYDEALAAVDAALKRSDIGDKRTNLEQFKKGIEKASHQSL